MYIREIRKNPLGDLSRIDLENLHNDIINNCADYKLRESDIDVAALSKCRNSLYGIKECEEDRFLGIIACRRINADDIDITNLIPYYPQTYVYKIEVLHYEKEVPDDKKEELIETCLVDKNDSFVIMELVCTNTINDIPLFKKLGFKKVSFKDGRIILIRGPRAPLLRILKPFLMKRKRR